MAFGNYAFALCWCLRPEFGHAIIFHTDFPHNGIQLKFNRVDRCLVASASGFVRCTVVYGYPLRGIFPPRS